jgi:hypothetical protein
MKRKLWSMSDIVRSNICCCDEVSVFRGGPELAGKICPPARRRSYAPMSHAPFHSPYTAGVALVVRCWLNRQALPPPQGHIFA